jgi:hypothetical protein
MLIAIAISFDLDISGISHILSVLLEFILGEISNVDLNKAVIYNGVIEFVA